jgi:hypothetical protein
MDAAPNMNTHPGGAPSAFNPPRRLPSVRRTTTHDGTWPEGFSGPIAMVASGRDLLTTRDGRAVVLDAARLDVVAHYFEGTVTAITALPHDPAVPKLVGTRIHAGFRPAVEAALPGERASRRVRFQLLDELPAAILAGGRSLRAAGIPIERKGKMLPVDLCAGWADGGTLLTGFSDFGPPLHVGPTAPVVESDYDTLAWHEMTPLPPHGTRRRRRLDLWEEDGGVWVDCFFRDSHVDADAVETVVHEWTVRAQVDPATRGFMSGAAQMGPLPYPECPAAAASAGRLAGMPLDGLRRAVKTSFVGPSTCTHLNDTLRSMEDVGALLDALHAHEA